MNQRPFAGYQIVLKDPYYRNEVNPRYRGIDRVPEYPSSIPEEMPILDEYVFGDYKLLETNLIPRLDAARELLDRLHISSRPYELLFCATHCDLLLSVMSEEDPLQAAVPLGYDIAGVQGDCWSIVSDMPPSPWTQEYQEALNANGLFITQDLAMRYLEAYRQHREPDFDNLFDVVFLARVPV